MPKDLLLNFANLSGTFGSGLEKRTSLKVCWIVLLPKCDTALFQLIWVHLGSDIASMLLKSCLWLVPWLKLEIYVHEFNQSLIWKVVSSQKVQMLALHWFRPCQLFFIKLEETMVRKIQSFCWNASTSEFLELPGCHASPALIVSLGLVPGWALHSVGSFF